MIIEEVKVLNWRHFPGEQQIFLATNEESTGKSLTLISAQNGVGKTSLLHAINWCFYGKRNFNRVKNDPEPLIYKHLDISGVDKVTAEVNVVFLYDGNKYRAKRRHNGIVEEEVSGKNSVIERRIKDGEDTALQIEEIRDGGFVPIRGNSDEFIQRVIPLEMSKHFFFYGEDALVLFDRLQQNQFGSKIKDILGSSVASSTLQSIKSAALGYSAEARRLGNSQEEAINTRIDGLKGAIDSRNTNIKKAKTELEIIEEKILNISDDAIKATLEDREKEELVAEKTRLKRNLEKTKAQEARHEQEGISWLGEYGPSLVAGAVLKKLNQEISSVEKNANSLVPFTADFVTGIIKSMECVCGHKIEEGSEEFDRIKGMLKKTGDEEINARIQETKHIKDKLLDMNKKSWGVKERIERNLGFATEQKNNTLAAIENNDDKLSKAKEPELKNLPGQLKQLEKDKKTQEGIIVRAENDLPGLNSDLSNERKKLKEAARKNAQSKIQTGYQELAEALSKRLENELNDQEAKARKNITDSINEVLNKYMGKGHSVELSDDYQLTIYDDRGYAVGGSDGEKTFIALAFTTALAKYAEARVGADDNYLLPGTVAPLIIDSSLGTLDKTFKAAVSEFLPQISGQVVLLLSDSQGDKDVIETLDKHIGARYVIEHHIKGVAKKNNKFKHFEHKGKVYNYLVDNAEKIGGHVKRVKHE